jgi:hypothetical protein
MPIADLPSVPPAVEAPAFDLSQLPGESRIDLRAVKPRCPEERSGEIVVCAPDLEKDRLRPLPDTYLTEEGLPRAEVGIGGAASLGVNLDLARLGGVTSNRVMVTAKLKF